VTLHGLFYFARLFYQRRGDLLLDNCALDFLSNAVALPLGRSDGIHSKDVHRVNLFEASILAFYHEEVDERD
jgi:hypothetical protein